MKLTLVMPSIGRKPGQKYISTWQMEPLVLALLAKLTPSEWEITIADDRVEAIDFDRPADLVAITVETYTARRAYQIAGEYRKRGVKVVCGGYHPTLVPDEVSQYSDSVVAGEAEGVWTQVLDDAKNGALKKLYKSPRSDSLSGLIPDRRVYEGKNYLPLTLVEFSRGCRHTCNFCSITAFYKATHRFRPPAEVAEEILKAGQKTVFIIDDNVAANEQAAMSLFAALKPLKINWVSQISVDAASNPVIVKAMAESGCMGVLIGFESLNPAILDRLNKQCNGGQEKYEAALELLRKYHICVYATFMFGMDGDNPSSFTKTMAFIRRHRFFLTAFNHLVPFPGTPLYARLNVQGRLSSPAWWLDPTFRFGSVAFRPDPMTANQVAQLCRKYRRHFYSLRSILHRGLDFMTNCQNLRIFALFMTQNFLGRREVEEKFGLPLGFVDPERQKGA